MSPDVYSLTIINAVGVIAHIPGTRDFLSDFQSCSVVLLVPGFVPAWRLLPKMIDEYPTLSCDCHVTPQMWTMETQ